MTSPWGVAPSPGEALPFLDGPQTRRSELLTDAVREIAIPTFGLGSRAPRCRWRLDE